MEPVEFEHHNEVFGKDQPEYRPLPALLTDDGRVISCWRLTWCERLTVLLRGVLWLDTLTFHTPLQPQRPSVTRPFEIQEPADE